VTERGKLVILEFLQEFFTASLKISQYGIHEPNSPGFALMARNLSGLEYDSMFWHGFEPHLLKTHDQEKINIPIFFSEGFMQEARQQKLQGGQVAQHTVSKPLGETAVSQVFKISEVLVQ